MTNETEPHSQGQGTETTKEHAPVDAAREAIDFGRLPPDPATPEFGAGVQALRPYFPERTAYNEMVCDQLAFRGVAPNGQNVLDTGKWGTKRDVGADVRGWYAKLSARLADGDAKIPETAKREANQLIEQLWSLACQAAAAPLQGELDALRQKLLDAEKAHAADQQEWQSQRDALSEQVESLSAAADALRAEAEVLSAKSAADAGRIVELNRLIADKALEHQSQISEIERSHSAKVEQLQAQAAEAQGALHQQNQQLQGLLREERARVDSLSRQHALAIDAFRVDLRSANERADRALQNIEGERTTGNGLREQLSSAAIEQAKSTQEIGHLRERLAEMEKTLAEVQRPPAVD